MGETELGSSGDMSCQAGFVQYSPQTPDWCASGTERLPDVRSIEMGKEASGLELRPGGRVVESIIATATIRLTLQHARFAIRGCDADLVECVAKLSEQD